MVEAGAVMSAGRAEGCGGRGWEPDGDAGWHPGAGAAAPGAKRRLEDGAEPEHKRPAHTSSETVYRLLVHARKVRHPSLQPSHGRSSQL